jgi:hypothetical protein
MARSIRILLIGTLFVSGFAGVLIGTARADVSQTPVATGCPAGYDRLSVASFEATGPYRLPRLIDTSGNGNGFVCAHVRPDSIRDAICAHEIRDGFEGNACRLEQLGLPIYLFSDDDNPASLKP